MEKRERGRIQGLPKFFEYPLLSQEWKKLATYFKFGQYIHNFSCWVIFIRTLYTCSFPQPHAGAYA